MIKFKKENIYKILLTLFLAFFSTNILHSQELYELEAEKIKYENKKDLIIAEGNAVAKHDNKTIYADRIFYYKDKNIIETIGNSRFEDGNNILKANQFTYYVNLKKIIANNNVSLEDSSKNKFSFDYFEFYQDKGLGTGKNLKTRLNDGSYIEANKGNVNKRNELTTLENVNYTTCSTIYNKKNQYCPAWSLNSKKVMHDKNKKKIIHKNTFLKIKNIPVLYSPYLSHPDPSVKRQSGFLPPLIKTISNIGRTFRVPYYWVLDDNKDLTITPIYYFDEKNSVLTSYRHALKNGFLQIENGYSGGYKRLDNNLQRSSGSRNYLFLKYNSNNELFFKDSELNFKLQRVSQRNFLRINNINTNLFNEDIKTLENSFEINSYAENKKINLRSGIFENLELTGKDKYTYLVPDISFNYYNNNSNNFNVNFNSFFQGKINQSQKETKFRNLINLNSSDYINKNTGIQTNLKASIININTFNTTLTDKYNDNSENYLTLALENSWPLSKGSQKTQQSITPNLFLKYTTGKMNDASNKSGILNYTDIFSMNRTNDLDAPETGLSLGHGIKYSFDRKIDDINKLNSSFGIGQVLRNSRLEQMPTKTSLNNKSSDIAGFVNFNYDFPKQKNNSNLSFDYNFNLSNDLQRLNRNNLGINWNYNKFSSSLIYDEKNDHVGDQRTAYINIKKIYNNNYFFKYEGKKNLLNDTSEYHKFSLNFENDCITTSIAFSKSFYQDEDITSTKNLIFSIILRPFGDGIAPDLTSFIN